MRVHNFSILHFHANKRPPQNILFPVPHKLYLFTSLTNRNQQKWNLRHTYTHAHIRTHLSLYYQLHNPLFIKPIHSLELCAKKLCFSSDDNIRKIWKKCLKSSLYPAFFPYVYARAHEQFILNRTPIKYCLIEGGRGKKIIIVKNCRERATLNEIHIVKSFSASRWKS